MSDDEFVEQVRHNNDIVDVVSEYVALEKRGSNMVGLCPFHKEDTPSFTVSPQRQLYYCFGCQAGGDVFNFIMDIEGYDFVEALEHLAERVGLDMPSKQRDSEAGSNKARVKRYLHKLGAFVARFFAAKLQSESGHQALRYLNERGIPPEVQEKYRLGWAPDSWQALCDHLRRSNVNMKAAQIFGVVKKSEKTGNYYDVLRSRIIFPITDPRGKVVGFGGRVIDSDDEPKYLNTPESPVFKKRETWYGLEQARPTIRQRDRVIIVEGYMDVLACCTYGWEEAVASMGTSLTADHARVLARYAEEALVAYDADAAGTDAAVRSMNQFTGTTVAVKVVSLPEGKDPDDVLTGDGPQAFERHLNEAQSFFRFCWERSQRRRDASSSRGKAEVIRDMAPLIWAQEDDVVRADRIRFMAESLRVPENAVRSQLSKLQKVAQKYRADPDRHNTKENYGTEMEISSGDLARWRAERQIIRMMLHAPKFLGDAREVLSANDFEDEVHRSLATTILRSDCSSVQKMQAEVMATCSDERERRALSEIMMKETIPAQRMQQIYSDCIRLLQRRRKQRRVEEIREIIREHDRQGKKIPMELMREQAEILAQLKGKQSSFNE